ncbi:S8 family serine peptidase [Pontibacter ruber]|uniref:S8 family serine peptidase n=1 Tax=Pontibacter ruber TaxID=1343895 RepID=A0ABW5CYY3_9BACT|nr:S8 family serine peptidase [Pontibacter ruber]
MRGLSLWLAAFAMAATTTGYAQRGTTPIRTNTVALERISAAAEKDYKANRAQALALAKKYNWVVEKTYKDGTHISLQGLDAKGLPIYYITYNNTRAAATTKTDQLWAGGSLGLNLSGSGSSVAEKMGIWDGGRIRETHQELRGRVELKDNASKVNEHATHVAGTMIASGVNALAKGMAFGTKKLMAYDFNNDGSEMAAAAQNLIISNHSYGSIAGWRYNSDRKGTKEDPYWEWWGDSEISDSEDYKFGYYDGTASTWDKIAYNAPYYLIVKSAGNNRAETGPKVGEPYYKRNKNGSFELVNARPSKISSNEAYDVISTYGTAKNILTVGGVMPIEGGYNQPSDVAISIFSSFGPTDDGRIKPDVVGNGVSVLSSTSDSDRAYKTLNGTSMAAPNVSGTLLLLQEHYANLNNGNLMRAATLKGLAIHTADEAGTAPGPDYIYGWGLLNAEKAARVISNTDKTHLMQENALAQGQNYTLDVVASGAGPLVVTISWTDPEAAALPLDKDALNNRTPRLVNDLDLRITNRFATHMPWVLNPASPNAAATRGDNRLDNVEQITIPNAVPGETYRITVGHKGTLSKGPQAYSLLVSGAGGKAYCTSSATSDEGARITSITLGSYAPALQAEDCTTLRDLTGTPVIFEPGQSQTLTLETGTCGANSVKAAKAFADWNRDGDFADAGESITLNGTGTFTGTITAPASLAVGTKVRLRIVLQETSSATNISACGTYTRGETQEHLIQINKPQKDVGIISVTPLGGSLCATPAQSLMVRLRNYGSSTQTLFPVTISVRRNGTEIAQLSGTYTGKLAPFTEGDLLLDGSFATEAGAIYEVIAISGLQNDAVESNNRVSRTLTISGNVAAPQAAAFRCGTGSNYTLTGSGEGSIFWYTSADASTPVAAGNQTVAPIKNAGTTLYAGLNDFTGTVGPSSKSFASGGGYNQFTPDVTVTAKAPMLIESARLYIGHKGKITFTVYSSEGAPVSSRTLNVTATRTTPAPGVQPNDPNDQGQVYYLGLELPEAGDYNIAISYADSATIFRNNEGVKGYPFEIPNVFAITGNTATASNGVGPEDYYYYFYDMKLRALGCKSERVAVQVQSGTPIATPAVSRVGKDLVSSAADGNQWYLNGRPINGATGKTFTPAEAGNYSVLVLKDGCISDMSNTYNFFYPAYDGELVSPNPSGGLFRVRLEASRQEKLSFEVTDMLGNLILKDEIEQYNGNFDGEIDLSSYASGVYILRLWHGDELHTRKLVLQH